MNISEAHEFLQFFIDKYSGAYYAPSELDAAIHDGQLDLFREWLPLYAVSQDIKDALSPFRDTYAFGYGDSLLGVVTVPPSRNYQKLLSLSITYDISARSLTRDVPLKTTNEDELADRLKSQTNPVTATTPVCEQTGLGEFQLYPKVQYRGEVKFLRLPVPPVYAYDTISGRVQVYNAAGSTQLEWREIDIKKVLVRALSSLGINLQENDIVQYAELKQQKP